MSRPRSALAMGLALAFMLTLAATGTSRVAAATVTPAYDAIPAVLPGNVGSTGYEAGRVNELGDHITLAGTERDAADLPVTVVMSVWACGNGGFRETCSTTPGQTFDQPITLNLYQVDNSGPNPALGSQILTTTQTFTLAFRPSPSPANCPSADFYPWYSAADNLCFSGLAQEITFDLSTFDDVLPDSLIWGIAFNGQISGYDPVGTQGPWNFLNLGTRSLEGQPAYGTDVEQDAVFLNSHYDWWYADGGAGGIDTFRRDTNWSNSRPLARFGIYGTTEPQIAPTGAIGGPCADPAYYGIFDNTASSVPVQFRFRWYTKAGLHLAKRVVPAGAIFRTWEHWVKPGTKIRVAYKNPATGKWVTLASKQGVKGTHPPCVYKRGFDYPTAD